MLGRRAWLSTVQSPLIAAMQFRNEIEWRKVEKQRRHWIEMKSDSHRLCNQTKPCQSKCSISNVVVWSTWQKACRYHPKPYTLYSTQIISIIQNVYDKQNWMQKSMCKPTHTHQSMKTSTRRNSTLTSEYIRWIIELRRWFFCHTNQQKNESKGPDLIRNYYTIFGGAGDDDDDNVVIIRFINRAKLSILKSFYFFIVNKNEETEWEMHSTALLRV